MNYTAREIADLTNSTVIGNPDARIRSIAFDSRTIFSVKEKAFLAINTSKNRGEKYIPATVEKGIKIIIAENKTADYEGVTWIIVKNAVAFLQKLAAQHLGGFPELKTIGITGSNGKSIVQEWL